jgi:hypothetical protein
MNGEVEFQVDWPPASPEPTGFPLLDQTLGRLAIKIGSDIATRFRTDNNNEAEQLFIPTYHLAEWIASNWWSLLFEPPKREDFEEDPGFRCRHWLGSARNGFALPDLWFCPVGSKMEISGAAPHLRFARLAFLVAISELTEISLIEPALTSFVERVILRLNDRGQKITPLHDAWNLIKNTTPEMIEYCRLIGSLGLSPYENHPQIDATLDDLIDKLNLSVIQDLCDTSDERTFLPLADITKRISAVVDQAPEADITELLNVPLPTDSHRHAWRWGREAVARVRTHFKISNADPQGGARFLAALGLGSVLGIDEERREDQIEGALKRQETKIVVAALDDREAQQRFTAARALFLGWAGDADASHLVTGAITRDQQASRAFAAEIMAPIGYVRARARNGILSNYRVQEIAEELNAPVGAVKYQAINNGLHIPSSEVRE